MLEPNQWDSVLSRARGTIYRDTERISSNALLNLLEVGPDPVTRQKVGKRLPAVMRRLGWTGPRAMRISADNGHAAGANGYWRLPTRPRPPDVGVGGDVGGEVGGEVDGLSDDLPRKLEEVTRLGLKKLEKVLRTPLDVTDANLVRSQVTAALGAVNAQLRADEQRLKTKVKGDVLERLLKIMAEEKKKKAAQLDQADKLSLAEGAAAIGKLPEDAAARLPSAAGWRRAVLTPRAVSARAMPRMLVTPLARISLIMGRTLAANALAISLRASPLVPLSGHLLTRSPGRKLRAMCKPPRRRRRLRPMRSWSNRAEASRSNTGPIRSE